MQEHAERWHKLSHRPTSTTTSDNVDCLASRHFLTSRWTEHVGYKSDTLPQDQLHPQIIDRRISSVYVTDFESDFESIGFRRFFTNLNPLY